MENEKKMTDTPEHNLKVGDVVMWARDDEHLWVVDGLRDPCGVTGKPAVLIDREGAHVRYAALVEDLTNLSPSDEKLESLERLEEKLTKAVAQVKKQVATKKQAKHIEIFDSLDAKLTLKDFSWNIESNGLWACSRTALAKACHAANLIPSFLEKYERLDVTHRRRHEYQITWDESDDDAVDAMANLMEDITASEAWLDHAQEVKRLEQLAKNTVAQLHQLDKQLEALEKKS